MMCFMKVTDNTWKGLQRELNFQRLIFQMKKNKKKTNKDPHPHLPQQFNSVLREDKFTLQVTGNSTFTLLALKSGPSNF